MVEGNHPGSITTTNVAFINKRVPNSNYVCADLHLDNHYADVVVRHASASAGAEQCVAFRSVLCASAASLTVYDLSSSNIN